MRKAEGRTLTRPAITAFVGATALGILLSGGAANAAVRDTVLVSAAIDSGAPNGWSYNPMISGGGQFVVFQSDASNLVAGDSNGRSDVFVRDLSTGVTTRVSVASAGAQANGASQAPTISADGRYVAFVSQAGNLAPVTRAGTSHVYVHDRVAGTTNPVSVSRTGTLGQRSSHSAKVSADGRFVTFVSGAGDLVTGDTNGADDVFVRDLRAGATTRVSVTSSGAEVEYAGHQSPSISADGRYVAFVSNSRDLAPGDTDSARDIFVHDRETHTTGRVSFAPGGGETDRFTDLPFISGDGRFVTYQTGAFDGAQTALHDRQSGATTLVSAGLHGSTADDQSWPSGISADGRYVLYGSGATNLVADDTNEAFDAFVYDVETATTTRLLGPADTQPNKGTRQATISDDNRTVAFGSASTNLGTTDPGTRGSVFATTLR